ncbi:DUF6355 family natural product biosynthesis protein [Micrococcus porci]|uniref:DUF6355 family natural product biosynthesis protein n=1 Tax=Micrococcus porci TaxID=2856555 RepID=UPI003CFB8C19
MKNGKLNTKNIMAMAAVGAVAVGGVSFLEISTADEASALQCGYSTRMEAYTSMWSLDLPIVGTVDPFGGKREVAYYGNCSGGNESIYVDASNGGFDICVTPGETKLGFTQHDRHVSGAHSTGKC